MQLWRGGTRPPWGFGLTAPSGFSSRARDHSPGSPSCVLSNPSRPPRRGGAWEKDGQPQTHWSLPSCALRAFVPVEGTAVPTLQCW